MINSIKGGWQIKDQKHNPWIAVNRNQNVVNQLQEESLTTVVLLVAKLIWTVEIILFQMQVDSVKNYSLSKLTDKRE